MKIKEIEIRNFKFHHNLKFTLNNKNCLIYGENGSGKSSIYEALYSNFYYYKNKKIVNSELSIRDTFLHRDFVSDDLEVNISFNNNLTLKRKDEDLENSEILTAPLGSTGQLFNGEGDANIYFANEKVLRHITDGNFFDVINEELKIHFPKLSQIESSYTKVKDSLLKFKKGHLEIEEVIEQRKSADAFCKTQLNSLISVAHINDILEHDLLCNFHIEYSFKDSIIKINEDYSFEPPAISFKIKDVEDRNDFKNHFNEAVFKLISIAVYFSLIKKYETENELKLLVLDDFLTSLDMANRKKIAHFIINQFNKYQMIILTHNIQFNNLLKRMIDETWDKKILFTMEEDNILIAKTKDKTDNFIKEARDFIDTPNYNLAIAGNLLRKAFESMVNEIEQLLEIGRVETLQKIINALKDDNSYFYERPHEVLGKLIEDFEQMFENHQQPDDAKIRQIKNKINAIKNNKITFYKDNGTNRSYNILKKTEFYKNILMNPSSHNDIEAEIYKQECKNTILLLEELNEILDALSNQ